MLAGAPCDADEAAENAPRSDAAIPAARTRRPRFLTRRKTGKVISIRKLEGREIIARS